MASRLIALVLIALTLGGCITAYTREAPEGIYPAGPLSGSTEYFVGWKFKF